MHHYCTVRQGTLTVALLLLAAPDIRAAVEHGGLVEGVMASVLASPEIRLLLAS
tara:strand:- start:14842 stop:15003 length:162 start_codon:yes stop_codon:yes gene_type:complete